MRYEDIIRHDFPYRKPSFLGGFSRGLNLFGASIKLRLSSDTAADETRAFHHDWRNVGGDLQRVLDRAGHE